MSIVVHGLKDLQAQLLDLGAKLGAKAMAQAARKAFKPVLESAKSMVPVDSGALRAAIKMSVVKPKGGDAVVVVGLLVANLPGADMSPARRWHFIELGTAHNAAHPFLRPALHANQAAVLELLKTELVKSIQAALKKKGS